VNDLLTKTTQSLWLATRTVCARPKSALFTCARFDFNMAEVVLAVREVHELSTWQMPLNNLHNLGMTRSEVPGCADPWEVGVARFPVDGIAWHGLDRTVELLAEHVSGDLFIVSGRDPLTVMAETFKRHGYDLVYAVPCAEFNYQFTFHTVAGHIGQVHGVGGQVLAETLEQHYSPGVAKVLLAYVMPPATHDGRYALWATRSEQP